MDGVQQTTRTARKSLKQSPPSPDRRDVKPSVLVIEDSASVRRLIEVCLRVLDVDVAAAEDGIKGLDTARTTLPDLIVLDIGLPGMDGWEVLRHLRAGDETTHIKVLVLTAHAQPEVAEQAAQGGADDFMTKPFRPGELRERLEKLLADA
jgi:CheY-like chemotaxis protein